MAKALDIATSGRCSVDLHGRRNRDRIVHVHVKDVRPEVVKQAAAADWSFLTSVLAGVYTAGTTCRTGSLDRAEVA